jgi:hydrogenase nickel incorporation protein HypA/HybF
MHEIGLLRQLVRTVDAFAAEHHIPVVREDTVDCGELSLVIPEYLQELYPVATKGSMLEGTRLNIHIIPGLAECDACDEIFNVIEYKGFCPNCGSFEKTVLSGKDFTVKEIVVPDPEDEESRSGAD